MITRDPHLLFNAIQNTHLKLSRSDIADQSLIFISHLQKKITKIQLKLRKSHNNLKYNITISETIHMDICYLSKTSANK